MLPHIEVVLRDKGESIPRPEYGQEADGDGGDEEGAVVKKGEGEGEGDEDEDTKKNFEATSEDED